MSPTKSAITEILDAENAKGIDPAHASATLRYILENTQGNIIKSHGRDVNKHLFIKFSDRDHARDWLARMATTTEGWQGVTSAWTQRADSLFRAEGMAAAEREPTREDVAAAKAAVREASTLFIGLLLSASGYDKLGLPKPGSEDDSFSAGAKGMARSLSDPPPTKWDEGFRRDLHALVIVAQDNQSDVDAAADRIADSLAYYDAGEIVHVENGAAMRVDSYGEPCEDGPPREHFGFLDGISTPLFFKVDIDKETKKAASSGLPIQHPSAPLNLVLVTEPDNGSGEIGCGSFFVYRKLKQHVARFKADRDRLAAKLKGKPITLPEDNYYVELAAAYIMGRFPDGTPVVLGDKPSGDENPTNDFDHKEDSLGQRCPYQAHTRKANPRGDTIRRLGRSSDEERDHRIVRRAVTYGPHRPGPTDDVGLLFLCAQADIGHQFEFIQISWCNSDKFLRDDAGIDPLIGQWSTQPDDDSPVARPKEAPEQQWPVEYGSKKRFGQRVGGSGSWVELRGAEYFFAPSLVFLRSCAPVAA
jgi:Dyp-type peroxidase family